MEYRKDMELCRAYIEKHLSDNIDPRYLADQLGYSFFHFCHVFRSCNGMAVGEYLRDRRLNHAAVALTEGQKVTKTAFDCGFETLSGFTRAFRRKFGVSPHEYQKKKGGIKHMNPEFKKFGAFTAVGYIIRPESGIDVRQNGAYWLGKDFSSISKEDYSKLTYPGYAEVGAWIHPEEEKDELYYFLGPTVKNKSFIPAGMAVLDVAEGEYAVFTVPRATSAKGLYESVNQTWKFIFNDWFEGSGYLFDQTKIDFEYYLGEETYIYVPVVKQ